MRADVAAGGAAVVGRDDLDRGASGAVEPETGEISKIMLSIDLVSDCFMVVLTCWGENVYWVAMSHS